MFPDRWAAFSIAIIFLCGTFGAQGQTSNDSGSDSSSTGGALADNFPCDQERTWWTVENTSQALELAKAVNCSGKTFNVEWKGNVVVEKTIYVADGTFLNVTGAGSGAVVNGTGATQLFMVASASLYLHNLNISNGRANNGGAVWASDANLAFNGTAFVGNNASSFGGALFLTGGSLGFFDEDTLFVKNYASFGGALYTTDNCSLYWNGGPLFTGNTAATSGGALHAAGGSIISLEGSKVLFSENSATEAGGALYVASNATVNMNGGAKFTENSILGNKKGVGGAISVSDAGSNVSWSLEASFTSNKAYSGGALYLSNGACVSYDGPTDFALNTAKGSGGVVGSQAFGSPKNAFESFLYIRAATSFINNTADVNGGGMALFGMVIVKFETTQKVTFSGNTADVAGGAIFLSGVGVPPTFSNIWFDSNLANIGGAVYAVASGIERIEGTPNPTTFIGCTFRYNSAKTSGGAVATAAGRDTFNDSVFIDNSATVGGALWLAGSVTIANCSFVDNVADEDGGPAVSNIGSINTVTDSSFDGNMFSCQPETFLDFRDSGDLYEIVCLGCPGPCSDCDFAKRMVPDCLPAIKHSSSPGGTVTLEGLRIDPGYWRATNNSLDIKKCPNMDACRGGLTGSKDFCKKGYEGPYCSICSEGYASCLDFSCTKCRDTTNGITLVAVLGVLTIFALAALASHLCAGEQNIAGIGIMGRILGLIPLQSLKIVIISWQILTQMTSVANITYLKVYERFLNVISVLNFDLSWVVSMGCIADIDFHDHLLIVTIGPFVALIFLGVTYTVAQNRHRWSAAAIRTVQYKHASAALLLTFLVYSSVSSVLFQMFSCDILDDGHVYLRADYRIKCDSPKHMALQFYAAAMIIIYPIGIVALYATLLLRNRKALQKKKGRENNLSIRSISELWRPYKPSRYYYELMECVRRALLSGVTVLIYPGPRAQVRVMMVIAFGFFGIAEGLAPYESTWNAWINRLGHVIIFMSLYVALLLEGEAPEADSKKYLPVEVILVFAHGCLVLALVVESLMLTCSLRSVPLEKPLPRFRSAKSFAGGQPWNIKDSETPFQSNSRLTDTATVGFPCTENTIGAPEDLFMSSESSSDEETKETGMIPNGDIVEGEINFTPRL